MGTTSVVGEGRGIYKDKRRKGNNYERQNT